MIQVGRLLIFGGVDDIGVPHMQNENKLRYIHEVTLWVQHLRLQDLVQFHGHLSQLELAHNLQAADGFASMTLHLSEDYGYAVAQAICCGLPVVTTEWGGGRFFTEKDLAFGVHVHLSKNGLRIAYDQAVEILKSVNFKLLPKKASFQSAENLIGIDAVAQSWHAILSEKPKHKAQSILLKEKSPQKNQRKFQTQKFIQQALVYGAIPIDASSSSLKTYVNPQYLRAKQHLFDPLSPKRSHLSDKGPSAIQNGVVLPSIPRSPTKQSCKS